MNKAFICLCLIVLAVSANKSEAALKSKSGAKSSTDTSLDWMSIQYKSNKPWTMPAWKTWACIYHGATGRFLRAPDDPDTYNNVGSPTCNSDHEYWMLDTHPLDHNYVVVKNK